MCKAYGYEALQCATTHPDSVAHSYQAGEGLCPDKLCAEREAVAAAADAEHAILPDSHGHWSAVAMTCTPHQSAGVDTRYTLQHPSTSG